MGRYRPPQPPSAPYITPEGHARLKRELKVLWRETRPEVTSALAAAAAEGDRSENAEYTYRKKQLGEIDRRIRYLSKRLDVLQVVDRIPTETSKIFFGCWVEFTLGAQPPRWARLVGPDEADPKEGYISVDSPIAAALRGRRAGDEVVVALPEGDQDLEVLRVQYTPP
jgi:transcription elongation factor GreB